MPNFSPHKATCSYFEGAGECNCRLQSPVEAYSGPIFSVFREKHENRTFDIVRKRPAVAILAVPGPGKVILVRQWRPAVGISLWEVPAGHIDDGETPIQAAIRECNEELGLVPGKTRLLTRLFSSPGFTDEAIYFVLCEELHVPAVRLTAEDTHHIKADSFTLEYARNNLTICDMKTVAALSYL